jgi:hypothetical protein
VEVVVEDACWVEVAVEERTSVLLMGGGVAVVVEVEVGAAVERVAVVVGKM